MKQHALHPLARARLARNLSQDMLADLTALSHATIERAEQGKCVRPSTRRILCDFFGLSAQDLGLVTRNEAVSKVRAEQEGSDMYRRQFLQLAGAVIAAPLFDADPWARIEHVFHTGTALAQESLDQLRQITDSYWILRANLSSIALLQAVRSHLHLLTQLLAHSLIPAFRRHVIHLTGESAQIAGTIAFDLDDSHLTQTSYQLAIQAAREAGAPDLYAIGLGRLALACNHQGAHEKALLAIADAGHAARNTNATIQAWLALVAAETHAHLHHREEADGALADAERLAHHTSPNDISYGCGFDTPRLFSYAGTCNVRLGRWDQAIPNLHQALALTAGTASRRRSTILSELATAHLGQQDIEASGQYALLAIQEARQAQSSVNLHRLRALYDAMLRWHRMPIIQQVGAAAGAVS